MSLIGDLEGHLRAKRVDAAARLLQEYLAAGPTDIRELARLAHLCCKHGQWAVAEAPARRLTELDADDARRWYVLGVVLRKLRRFDEARQAQGRALALAPTFDEAVTELAKIGRDRHPAPARAPAALPPLATGVAPLPLGETKATIKCPGCSSRNTAAARNCWSCGYELITTPDASVVPVPARPAGSSPVVPSAQSASPQPPTGPNLGARPSYTWLIWSLVVAGLIIRLGVQSHYALNKDRVVEPYSPPTTARPRQPEPSSPPARQESPPVARQAQPAPQGYTYVPPGPPRPPPYTIWNAHIENDGYWDYVCGYVRNNTGRRWSYAQVQVSLYDANGARIGSAWDNINDLEPGGVWRFRAIIMERGVARASITDLTYF